MVVIFSPTVHIKVLFVHYVAHFCARWPTIMTTVHGNRPVTQSGDIKKRPSQ